MGLHLFYVIALAILIPVSRSSAVSMRRLSRVEYENLNEICGKSFASDHPRSSVQRVARGSLAKQGEFPWAVRFNKDCSGTIISKYHVITAAHCVIPENTYRGPINFDFENAYIIGASSCGNITAYFQGSPVHIPLFDERCTGRAHENPRTLRIKSIIVPRNSRRAQMETPRFEEVLPDIAILELEDPISYIDDKLLPICVPSIFTKTPLTYTSYGFGDTEKRNLLEQNGKSLKLRKLLVRNYKLLVPNKCESTWNNEKRCDSVTFLLANEDGSMCGGDSGGTLSGFVAGKEYLFGVVNTSSRKNCYNPMRNPENRFTVTWVAYYSDFLCFYTGVCPLGYDVYSKWNYLYNPEAVFLARQTGYKKASDEGNYMLPVRKVKAEQESPDKSYREKE